MVPGDELTVGGVRIVVTMALHHGDRRPFGPSCTPIGFRIEGTARIYFAGDTDLFPAMADLADRVDVALLPVWGWGPRLGPGHLDPRRAAEAVRVIRPRMAIPVHWGTFNLAFHDWAEPADRLWREAKAADVRLAVPRPGERVDVDDPPPVDGWWQAIA